MTTKRWWISWYESVDAAGDFRPRMWPLTHGIVEYWCTGTAWRHSKDGGTAEMAATLCAVVDAEDAHSAKEAISAQGWTPTALTEEEGAWRFCSERPSGWMPSEDRFPYRDEDKETSK